ncbi:putative nuclease HARBI1 [Metopolophium dirhodum]|uniref:putative nuclease HARBI1 n=1 Tax=Metopolophium dirhodum TaxID=44670 RepID=UPI00298FAED0|nr:putative nuclease HARBI1 [Metopolophium dirhodum]
MSSTDFEFLINLIGPKVAKENTNFRESISVSVRLAITLRFLSSGESYHSLMYTFKVSKQSISEIVPEVCEALISGLKNYIKMPTETNEWLKISADYEEKWNFPHCLGALDGKHILLQAPINSGSEFFNYKGHFSIVLMALVDANYSFIYINAGCQGRISDGGVFKNTDLWKRLENKSLNLPEPISLPGRDNPVPYVIVADDAFSLSENVMKPYPGHQTKGSKERIFNYRLSRARRVSENVFGIMSSIFRVLRKPILLSPEKATSVTLACAYLHNFLRASKSSKNCYTPQGSVDIDDGSGEITPGTWRRQSENSSCLPLQRIGRKSGENSKAIRYEFATYFTSETGSVPWQDKYA